ncbi:hypothetical protein MPC1_110012 [Methylocella tundrae]|nr:hypothetical protein MPC1_110012 [Methylocella tundrae]
MTNLASRMDGMAGHMADFKWRMAPNK